MNLIDKVVVHKQFGKGVIKFQDDNNITVQFDIGEKKFQHPMAFEHFLKLLDDPLTDELEKIAIQRNEEIRTIEIERVNEKLIENKQLSNDNSAKKIRKKTEHHLDLAKDILSIHQNCFDFLLNYQKEHEDLYFIPRKNNAKNRLEDGYHFIGSDSYLMITFWNGGDSVEKIHNINLGIMADGNCFIEMSSRANDVLAGQLKEIVGILEKTYNFKFEEVKVNKWRFDYDPQLSYIEILTDFIENEKVKIDEYINSNKSVGIELANRNHHEKYVKKIVEMHR